MLINRRNALMSGKRLPYDAELEYLGSTGTEVLDTGYIPVDGDVLAFPANASYTNGGSIDGCITATRRRLHGFNVLSAVYVGATAHNIAQAGAVWSYDSEWRVDLSRHTLTFGDTTIPFSSDASLPNVSFCFLARHNNMSGSPIYDNHRAGSRFRYFKVYRNQEPICDFIPVRVGTVGYLYDRVSGKLFGNAGTGDFVLGPDVVPVEYIESHGTEYIDTGILPTSSDRFTGSFSYVGSAPDGTQYLAGANATTTGNVVMRLISSGAFNISGFGQASISLGTYTNTLSGFVVASEDFSYNGTTSSASWTSGLSIDRSLYLFARHARSSTANITSGMRIGSFCIERNDVKIIDLLPVRVGTEGAMMDVLTRRIYRNAGTGAFTYGNDLKYPIPSE